MTNEELIALVRDKLLYPALRDEELAREVCHVAGILARDNETLTALIEERMKPRAMWSKYQLVVALVLYAEALKDSDPRTARDRLRKYEERRTGKPISDKRIQNILSEAAR